MSQTLHVGNVADSVTDQQLRDLFSPSGAVLDARVMTDKATGAHRGFALVTLATPEDAQGAVRALNGSSVAGQRLSVRPAIPRPPGWEGGNDQGGGNRSRSYGVGNGGSRY